MFIVGFVFEKNVDLGDFLNGFGSGNGSGYGNCNGSGDGYNKKVYL
jgi:hypothetical protein